MATSPPFEPHPYGVVIRIKARPGARRNAFAGLHDGALRVDVTAAPEKGKANEAIVSLLAKQFQLSKSQVELISSPANPQKKFLLTGVDEALVDGWLRELF